MAFHLIRQCLLLRLVAVLEKLLDHVVAEHIGHELHRIGQDLAKGLVFLVTVGRFELLLDESGPMLIAAEFNYMAVNVLLEVSHPLDIDSSRLLWYTP